MGVKISGEGFYSLKVFNIKGQLSIEKIGSAPEMVTLRMKSYREVVVLFQPLSIRSKRI